MSFVFLTSLPILIYACSLRDTEIFAFGEHIQRKRSLYFIIEIGRDTFIGGGNFRKRTQAFVWRTCLICVGFNIYIFALFLSLREQPLFFSELEDEFWDFSEC
jgi:hypothetical protein